MWPVSDRFLAAMQDSHTVTERVRIIDATGATLPDDDHSLIVAGGEIVESAGAMIRHSGHLTVLDPNDEMDDLLAPGVNRLLLEKGIRFGPGDEELVPVMTGHIKGRRPGRGLWELTLLDRTMLCQRRATRTVVIPAGTPVPDAIYETLLAVDRGLSASLMTSEWTVPQQVFPPRTDLGEKAAQMAEAGGAVLYIDRLDGLVVAPRPLVSNSPVWTIRDTDPTFVDATSDEDIDQVPNVVTVTGQHSSMSEPVYGTARDLDPTSPTYVQGPAGERVWEPPPTSMARTPEQAEEMAEGLLAQALGGSQEVQVELSVSPVHLMATDVVDLDLPSRGVRGRFVLHSRPAALGPAPQTTTITLRRGVLFDAA